MVHRRRFQVAGGILAEILRGILSRCQRSLYRCRIVLAHRRLRRDAPTWGIAWQLWLFGVITVPIGFALWNGQGSHFGLGRDDKPVSPRIAWGTCIAAVTLSVIGMGIGR